MNTKRNSSHDDGSFSRCAADRSRTGFTLAELLVVIATLAVLAALVLPALAGTRPNSQLLQCLNNQKKLATAWLMYAPDNDDRVVGFNTVTMNLDWRKGAASGAGTVTGLKVAPPAGLSGEPLFDWSIQEGYREEPLYKYAPNPLLIHCPGDKRISPGGTTYYYDSYSGVEGLNGGNYVPGSGNSGSEHNATPIMKSSGLRHPNQRFLWVEENDIRGDNQGSWWFDPGSPFGSNLRLIDCPAVYHFTGSTFSFADGHSESRPWGQDGNTISLGLAGFSYPVAIPNPNSDLRYIAAGYPCVENP